MNTHLDTILVHSYSKFRILTFQIYPTGPDPQLLEESAMHFHLLLSVVEFPPLYLYEQACDLLYQIYLNPRGQRHLLEPYLRVQNMEDGSVHLSNLKELCFHQKMI